MKKIYIAGKITGLPLEECKAKFAAAAAEIKAAGFIPVNPFDVVDNDNASWTEAMRLCIAALVSCDGVLLLPCHVTSTGALYEKRLSADMAIPTGNSISSLKLMTCLN